MKKMILITGVLVLAEFLNAAPKYDPKTDPRNSPEAKAARRERRLRNTGGFVEDMRNYKGQFLFLNSQEIVKPSEIQELTVGTMNDFFRSKFAIVNSEKFNIAMVKDLMKKADAQGAIFLVDDPVLPALLAAPEESWGVVNVAKLNTDKPERDLLCQRVRREMWRALSYTLGCVSPADICVMKPVGSLNDLDNLSANAPSRYPLYDIRARLPQIGVGAIRTTSYKVACEEGWALPPTNDYQKVIWERIKAEQSTEATKGLKIKYDPKKGK